LRPETGAMVEALPEVAAALPHREEHLNVTVKEHLSARPGTSAPVAYNNPGFMRRERRRKDFEA